jgi:hypothetical protein
MDIRIRNQTRPRRAIDAAQLSKTLLAPRRGSVRRPTHALPRPAPHPRSPAHRCQHTSIKTTLDIYGHLYEPLDEIVADRLEKFITTRSRTERARNADWSCGETNAKRRAAHTTHGLLVGGGEGVRTKSIDPESR